MKGRLLWPLLLLLGYTAGAQQRIIDRAPSGDRLVRAVEGGGEAVPVDTVTSLEVLIQRLRGDWELVETGKGYWIGYTDDMYSIAARGEQAVEPLQAFFKANADNPQAQAGTAYTLHLIGINCRIAGRFYEEFTNRKARQALLALLEYPQMSPLVTSLLLRDPWQSDVPAILHWLQRAAPDNWALVNAVKFYGIPGLPLQPELPARLADVSFAYPRLVHQKPAEEQAAVARGERNRYDTQVFGILKAIRALNRPDIHMEDSLLTARRYWGWSMTEFGCRNCVGVGDKELTLGTFLGKMRESRVQYYLNDQQLVICSSHTARQLVLTWWNARPATFRTGFNQDKAAPPSATKHRWGF